MHRVQYLRPRLTETAVAEEEPRRFHMRPKAPPQGICRVDNLPGVPDCCGSGHSPVPWSGVDGVRKCRPIESCLSMTRDLPSQIRPTTFTSWAVWRSAKSGSTLSTTHLRRSGRPSRGRLPTSPFTPLLNQHPFGVGSNDTCSDDTAEPNRSNTTTGNPTPGLSRPDRQHGRLAARPDPTMSSGHGVA